MYLSVHGSDHFYRVLDNVKYVRKLISDQYNDVLMLASCIMVKGMGDYKDEFRAVFSHYFDDILFFPAKSQGGRYNRLNSLTSYDFSYPNPSEIMPCEMLWNRYHLTAEGLLSACCVDYEHDLIYADFNTSTLSESWNNSIMKQLRLRHIEKRLEGTVCYNCLTGKMKPILVFLAYLIIAFLLNASIQTIEESIKQLRKEFLTHIRSPT